MFYVWGAGKPQGAAEPERIPPSLVSHCVLTAVSWRGSDWTFHAGWRVTPLDNIWIHHSSWTLPTVVINYERKKKLYSCRVFLNQRQSPNPHIKNEKKNNVQNSEKVSRAQRTVSDVRLFFQHEKVNSVSNHSHRTFPQAAGKIGRGASIKCTQACGPRALPATYRERGGGQTLKMREILK